MDHYNLIAANIRDFAMFILNSEGRITAWNPTAERILGWREDEALGQPAAMIFTPEDRAAGAPEGELRRAAQSGNAEDVRWHVRKDGSRFFAEGITTALKDEAGNLRGFGKVLRDMTERKRQEEMLAALHQQTSVILESIGDAFYAVDGQFRFTYINRRAEE